MASKQLGKLRQWAGEVISTRDKTILTEEFKDLERDVELRRAGIERLSVVCDAYHKGLTKKKEVEGAGSEGKILPTEALGSAMIQHGDEFGEESAFGHCLVRFGKAHYKIAKIQEEYAEMFETTYVASLATSLATLKEYQAQRKKLDSRRLALDAANTKLAKAKKEKEKTDAEIEVETAKDRYEEMSEDVQARMYTIQENELQQLRDLTEFLDIELDFAQNYLAVLSDLKKEWLDESSVQRVDVGRARTKPSQGFSAPAAKSAPPSTRGSFSNATGGKLKKDKLKELAAENNDSDNDDGNSTEYVDAYSDVSRPRSRANSTATNMTTTSTGTGKKMGGWLGLGNVLNRKGSSKKNFQNLDVDQDNDEDEVKAKPPPSPTKKQGKKEKEADKVSAKIKKAQRDEEEVVNDSGDSSQQRSRTSLSMSLNSFSSSSQQQHQPQLPPRAGAANSNQKIVRALYDFTATSPDELSLRVGDEVVVLGEVSEGWWTGESRGKTGMFPANYTKEVMKPILPPPPSRLASANNPNLSASLTTKDIMREPVTPTSDDGASQIVMTSKRDLPNHNHFASASLGDDEPFGDHHARAETEDDDAEIQNQGLLSNSHSGGSARPRAGSGAAGILASSTASIPTPPFLRRRSSSGKKPKAPPPPPPARRSTTTTSNSKPKHNPSSSVGSLGQLEGDAARAAFAATIVRSRPNTPGQRASTRSPFDFDAESD